MGSPVAADLSGVATELVVWRLIDDTWGVCQTIDDATARALLEEVALGLIEGDVSATEPRVSVALAWWRADIPRLWQTERRIDDRVYQHVRVLEAALAACAMPAHPERASAVLEASTYGANGVNVKGDHEAEQAMQGKLVELLRNAGGW